MGSQTALVVGLAGAIATTARDHQVKIQFAWQRGAAPNSGGVAHNTDPRGNAPGNETSGAWVRVAEALAGPNWGSQFTPRIGTEVLSRTPPASYRQPTNSISDLLQYADDTRVEILSKKRVACERSLAELLECRVGQVWLRVDSLRTIPGAPNPICMTTAYLDARLPDLERNIEGLDGPISAMLERIYGLRMARIEQSIDAISLGKRQAKLLLAEPGSPALRATRRYYREDGTLVELSSATHPGDRFTYVTSLVRG